jgi:hypothetical protein
VQKIGRNEPCPCGSGKKYKKCCLEKEQENKIRMRDESTVATRALNWLGGQFPEGIRHAVQTGFYGGLKKTEKKALDGLTAEKHELLTINIGEWLLTDAKIPVNDDVRPVHELILGTDGPMLSDVGRRWLSDLGKRSLSLYEVCQTVAGNGILVKDLLQGDAPEVWVPERKLSQSLVRWDIFGARLVANGNEWKFSGAVYPLLRETANTCKAKILRKAKGMDMASEPVREICCSIIATEWLRSLVTETPLTVGEDAVSDGQVELSVDFFEKWIEEPLAALGDRSPRNALKTAAGSRAVVELLKSYENRNLHHVRMYSGESFDFGPLWSMLGLKREGE